MTLITRYRIVDKMYRVYRMKRRNTDHFRKKYLPCAFERLNPDE